MGQDQEHRPIWGNRSFRAKSGGLFRKIVIDQRLPHPPIAGKPWSRRALLQGALQATTARFRTKRTITPFGQAPLLVLTGSYGEPIRGRVSRRGFVTF